MRKLMWFAVGFGAACIMGAYFYAWVSLWLGIAVLAGSVMFAIGARYIRSLRIPAVILLAFAVGIGWFRLYDSQRLAAARAMDGQTAEAVFTVSDYSYLTDYGSAAAADVTLNGNTYRALVYLNESGSCAPGDLLTGSFRFRFTAEGGADEPTYHRSEGIFLLAYQNGDLMKTSAERIPVRCYPAVWRHRIAGQIDTIFPKDAAAFAKALLLGDRTDIDYGTNTAFKLSGISHVIAVSGLHVSILFGVIYLLTGRNRYLSSLLGIPAVLLFAAIAGFTPSITRAAIMLSLMLLAAILKREYDPPTALAFAVIVMLTVNPMVIISISFQLSVGCMIGIFLFQKRIQDWLLSPKRLGSAKGKGILPRVKRWFASSVSVSLSAGVLTTALTACYFGTISLVSLLTNLLVLWLISYIFYGILLSLAVSLISLYAGSIAAFLVALPVRIVTGMSKLLAGFPLAAVYTESAYIVVWLIGVYILLGIFLCMKKKPVLIFGCCVILSLCAALGASWVEPLLDECRVTLLDVGQGQCILLQSEGKTYLVDCGGDSDTACADLAAQTLLSYGIRKLDGVIVTHYDADHAGGIPYLLTRIGADAVYLPDIADEDGLRSEIINTAGNCALLVSDDLTLRADGLRLTIFGPETYNSGNESCLCVLFQTENCDILVTGDRGALGEMLLLHRASLPELEVLIAGHHGSAGSTGEALLAATSPEYVLISNGADNPYGHPAQALLERLEKYGCTVYRTDLSGTIIYRG